MLIRHRDDCDEAIGVLRIYISQRSHRISYVLKLEEQFLVDVGINLITFGGPGASIFDNLDACSCPGRYPGSPEPGRGSETVLGTSETRQPI